MAKNPEYIVQALGAGTAIAGSLVVLGDYILYSAGAVQTLNVARAEAAPITGGIALFTIGALAETLHSAYINRRQDK